MNTERAWLLDLYARQDRIVLWFVTEAGERLRLEDPFAPSFFADGRPGELARAREWAARVAGLEWRGQTERTSFWTGRPFAVQEIRMTDLERAGANVRALERAFPELTLYNCDIPPEIHYGYERALFPTARCRIEHLGGRLIACAVEDDPYDIACALPELRQAELRAEGALVGRWPRLRSLTLAAEGRAWTWDAAGTLDLAELMHSFAACLAQADPDLLWTRGGDATLIPVLLALAERAQVELPLDREPAIRRALTLRGRSYMSYGRILYQAPDYPLFGRWHIDRNNSFWAHTTGLEGLIEVARVSKIPVQRAARRSIGTGISSIELDHAYREGCMIPWKKSRPEDWKSAALLIRADRGGLVYQPQTGVYEDVIELDFVSMYPSIMTRFNVSPETIQCDCCPDAERRVPELDYRLCQRRRGLVPRALAPIIEKRRAYKRLMKEPLPPGLASEEHAARREAWDGRQDALKWLLVCCFGYLGYRNARFGRIEAHESTCAFSRELLLVAREVCEDAGFSVLHAIVDCVWIQKKGATEEEIERLIEKINHATGLTIALEGRYSWLAFLPSRQDEETPVPNRYFGRFATGKVKYRGIEIRRSDQAPFIQEVQGRLFEILREADSLAACRALRPRLLAAVEEALDRLRLRDVALESLILERRTSREPGEYKNNSMNAVAVRQAERVGISLHAGQAVRYVVVNAASKDPDSRVRILPLLGPGESYDVEFYAAQVRQAAATLLEPLLGESIDQLLPSPEPPIQPRAATSLAIRSRTAATPPNPPTEHLFIQLDLFADA